MNYKRIFTFIIFFILYYGKVIAQEETVYDKIDLFGEVLDKINKEYVEEVDQSDTMDAAINGVLQSLDPYSSYMSPKNLEEMQTETKGEFGGLGIEVGMEAGVVKVISPLDNSPAEREGVKAGDYIVKIGKEQVQGKSLLEAVKLMRGPVGTSINLTVRRKNEKKPIEFTITRKIIEVQSVNSKIIGDQKNLGYIRLKSFNENSDKQFLKSVKEFEKKIAKKFKISRQEQDEFALQSQHKANLAINNPVGCQFIMFYPNSFDKTKLTDEDYIGKVPFAEGRAIQLDVGNYHAVRNNSKETRYHIIVHGNFWPDEKTKSLYDSSMRNTIGNIKTYARV